ncbi:MAG: Holliday junction resolvase RuvX [Chloroflexi bacterium HGW-Chloroflexi-4]|jgi:putative Holliday junction resolvase|nr:MAG: Holliday junction resolvase RuvX [Chloroflexi bacterium HGW-Chloroflexi-4]
MALDAVSFDQHFVRFWRCSMTGRIMAVDPGEKRIGLAISDETATLARGLGVIKHVSLKQDCIEITELAKKNEATRIIIGSPIGENNEDRPQTRHAQKVAEMLAEVSGLPVELWDENGSTNRAKEIRLESGAKRDKRGGHLDEVAAAVILQTWLEEHHKDGKDHA